MRAIWMLHSNPVGVCNLISISIYRSLSTQSKENIHHNLARDRTAIDGFKIRSATITPQDQYTHIHTKCPREVSVLRLSFTRRVLCL